MNELKQAQQAVQAARVRVDDLEHAHAMLTEQLPKARQELEAARAKLRRLNQLDGTAATLCQQAEIDRLTAAIIAANGGTQNV
ncbi:hypothetical protein [Pseudomonas sp. Kh13]|uniref:hypothetical protein n=1 Tax=Pseudomonas sp. Kh13 TaxID=2093744 RepID=UPI0011838BAE|nr:hypothetical protein [Pseudomonas sp. Kh13]